MRWLGDHPASHAELAQPGTYTRRASQVAPLPSTAPAPFAECRHAAAIRPKKQLRGLTLYAVLRELQQLLTLMAGACRPSPYTATPNRALLVPARGHHRSVWSCSSSLAPASAALTPEVTIVVIGVEQTATSEMTTAGPRMPDR